jgi:hypothetical protein
MKILLFLLAAAAALTATGCSSNCGSRCPITTVRITGTVNVNLPIRDVAWVGPACPSFRPTCRGDDMTTICTHLDVPGSAEGICDVFLAFTDRPSMAIRTQFGPATTVGCCGGYPVVGDWLFTIPVASDAGIYGGDGSTDAVSLITDAGDASVTDAGVTDADTDTGAADATTDASPDAPVD